MAVPGEYHENSATPSRSIAMRSCTEGEGAAWLDFDPDENFWPANARDLVLVVQWRARRLTKLHIVSRLDTIPVDKWQMRCGAAVRPGGDKTHTDVELWTVDRGELEAFVGVAHARAPQRSRFCAICLHEEMRQLENDRRVDWVMSRARFEFGLTRQSTVMNFKGVV